MNSGYLLKYRSGRELRFSPEWRAEHVSVVFDANSGDFWIVQWLARLILVRIRKDTAIAVDALTTELGGELSSTEDLVDALDSLVETGLIIAQPAAS